MALYRRATSIIERLKILVSWVPVIWNDSQWDWGYLIVLLRHKLFLMEKYYGSGLPYGVDHLKKARDIKIARVLCDRIIKSDYHDSATKHVGDLDWTINSDMTLTFSIKNSPEKDPFKAMVLWETASNKAEIQEKADFEYLLNHLSKNLKHWWD